MKVIKKKSVSERNATETFQEIQNVRDFGIESMWSGSGGFIGIFLGYSLLQVPDILDIEWKSSLECLKIFTHMIAMFGRMVANLFQKVMFINDQYCHVK